MFDRVAKLTQGLQKWQEKNRADVEKGDKFHNVKSNTNTKNLLQRRMTRSPSIEVS